MNIEHLAKQFEGVRFGELVLNHYRKFDLQHIAKAFVGTKELLPQHAQPILEHWIDQFGSQSRTNEFWTRDCGETLDEICNAAKLQLAQVRADSSDENLFNMFQLVVLNFAYSCHMHETNRMFIQKALGHGLFRRYFNLR